MPNQPFSTKPSDRPAAQSAGHPAANKFAPLPELPDDVEYRPFTWRRRLLLALLAVATAVTIVLTLLDPLGGIKRHAPPPPPEPARCGAGQSTDCVGGMATIIVTPPSSVARPASAAPR